MNYGNVSVQKAFRNTTNTQNTFKQEMWANPNAQRDGRPSEYRWCPLFNAAKFG